MVLLMALALAAQSSPSTPTGVIAPAATTVKGQPATFDLAGFRLGMGEADVEQVLRARGMKVLASRRATTFEDTVRGLVNIRGGQLAMKGGNVLLSAEIDDGNGGKVMLDMLPWPDGAHVQSVAYLPPAGTEASAWRALLVERFGVPARDSDRITREGLHASWCGQTSCSGEGGRFRLVADVSAQGGQIVLSQPEGMTQTLGASVEAEAARRMSVRKPVP